MLKVSRQGSLTKRTRHGLQNSNFISCIISIRASAETTLVPDLIADLWT